jgi:hypothetical protein
MSLVIAMDAGDRLIVVLVIAGILAALVGSFLLVGGIMVGGEALSRWLSQHRALRRSLVLAGPAIMVGSFIGGLLYVTAAGFIYTLIMFWLYMHGQQYQSK